VEVHRDQAVGVVGTTAGEGMPALVLQGHLDVVPAGDPGTWQGTDPFSAEIREGRLYGRGACDMKAGVAANLAVVRTLRAAGVQLERPLAVHCVVGEEDGGLGAFATLRRGHRGDAAVITEPTGGRLVTATAGALTFRIEVVGRSAHGSMRREGVSAFEAFLPVHRALLELEGARNVDIDPLFAGDLPYALSVGVVQAGDWASNVPDRLVAEGRLGVRLDEDPRQARLALEDAVTEASLSHPWLQENRPVVTWPGGQFASGRTDPDHPLVDEVRTAVVDATGGEAPPLAAEVYGSDLRLYVGIGGIPTLHYGPGDIRVAHAPLEYVDLDEVVQATRALTILTLRRCGTRE
jgi:acetylornithine deacetylase